MKILIVDDHVLFREGLSSLIAKQTDLTVVGEAGSVHEAIEKARTTLPEMILLDFNLPDGTGLDATRAILAELPDVKIVFLTIYEVDERLFAAIRAGAQGYLLKNIPVAKLLAALRGLIERGEAAITRQMTSRLLTEFSQTRKPETPDTSPLDGLTSREREILRYLASGATNQEIALQLVISENTVKNHVHNILEKLGLRSRREIRDFARIHNLIPSEGQHEL
jgi:two-component system NarL family response regulator